MAYIRHERSSQIHSTDYDPVDQSLHVRFNCHACQGSGKPEGSDFGCDKCKGAGFLSTYRYPNVPADVYAKIRDAESVGKAFHAEIKSRPDLYPYERV